MAGPKVGNRASSDDVSYYEDTKPGKPGFVEESDRRRLRTDAQVRKESLSRVGAGKIGQPSGKSSPTPKPAPTKVAPATVPQVTQPPTAGKTTAGRGAAWLRKENL